MENPKLFTTPCFIHVNTIALQKYLEDLGYINYWHDANIKMNTILAVTSSEIIIGSGEIISRYMAFPDNEDVIELISGKCIDCGINKDLFLAIAALREDSDYMQYFKGRYTETIIQCTSSSIDNYIFPLHLEDEVWDKMTVEELKNYFNKQ